MIGSIVLLIAISVSIFFLGYVVGYIQGYKDWKKILETKDDTIRTLRETIRIKDKIK